MYNYILFHFSFKFNELCNKQNRVCSIDSTAMHILLLAGPKLGKAHPGFFAPYSCVTSYKHPAFSHCTYTVSTGRSLFKIKKRYKGIQVLINYTVVQGLEREQDICSQT